MTNHVHLLYAAVVYAAVSQMIFMSEIEKFHKSAF